MPLRKQQAQPDQSYAEVVRDIHVWTERLAAEFKLRLPATWRGDRKDRARFGLSDDTPATPAAARVPDSAYPVSGHAKADRGNLA
jgi:hypothetical protein